MKFKLKKLVALLVTSFIGVTSICPAFANENEYISDKGVYESNTNNDSIVQPQDKEIGSGSIYDSVQFVKTCKLDEKDGKYVNFHIKNTGNVSITTTINGEKERSFSAGESGHIYLEVKNGILGIKNSYTFKAVPTKNGGKISMDWIIAQRDKE